tara:strand:- start:283 stop:546 length:264 start_codon:yes stop_codon:yes gene_type:complete
MIIKNIDYTSFLKTIKENTDNNCHTENAVLIAVNFGKELQKQQAIEIMTEHKSHMPYYVGLARDYLVKDILHNMDNKRLSKQINSRL